MGIVTIRSAGDGELQNISQTHSLNLHLAAMHLLRAFYEQANRDATIAELKAIANWQPISPTAVTLPSGTPMSFAERLLAILAQLANHHAHKSVNASTTQPHLDPYALAWAAVDASLSHLVAAGANVETLEIGGEFQWKIPHQLEQLGALVRLMQGVCDTAVSFQTPLTLTNTPGSKQSTLHITTKQNEANNTAAVPKDLQQAGNFLFVVGDTRAELGGSHFNQVGGRAEGSRTVPKPMPDGRTRMYLLHQAMQAGLVQACCACESGGVATTLATMCLAGELGAELQLIHVPRDWHAAYSTDEVMLFAESLSRFIVEVHPEDAPHFRKLMADVPHECVAVVGGDSLIVNGRIGAPILTLPLTKLAEAWKS